MLMTGYDFNAYVILVIFTERCDGKKEFEIIDNSYLALKELGEEEFILSIDLGNVCDTPVDVWF